jgi:hypothetical protein
MISMLSISPALAKTSGRVDTTNSPPGGGYEGPSTVPAGTHVDYTITDECFLSVTPNLVGVGQTILVNMWITFPSGEGKYMNGYNVVIKDPDGNSETVKLKSYVADGTSWFEYYAEQPGEYSFQFFFDGEYFPEGYWYNGQHSYNRTGVFSNAIYNPSVYCTPGESRVVTITVQEDYVRGWDLELPASTYWTHPVQPNMRNSWDELGNYPWIQANIVGVTGNAWTDNYYGPYIPAVNTPHIVWKRVNAVAGMIGGEAYTFSRLASGGTPAVIFMGRAYQTRNELINGVPTSCAVSYDLRTGKLYYARPVASGGVTPKYIGYWSGTSQASDTLTAELIALSGSGANTRLLKIDPTTGAISANISIPGWTGNGSAMDLFYRDGYLYSFQGLSSISDNPAPGVSFVSAYVGNLIKWSTQGTTTNFNSRIESNVTVTLPRSYRTAYQISDYGNILAAVDYETMISVQQHRFLYGGFYGYSLEATDLTTGKQIWTFESKESEMSSAYRPTNVWVRNGLYIAEMELGSIKAWDLHSGKEAWTVLIDDWPWGEFWMYDEAAYQDWIYAVGYTGIWAINQVTGKVDWKYSDPAIAFETAYTAEGEPTYSVQDIRVVGGLLYVSNNEHTPTQPAKRGWGMICLNGTTGDLQWKVLGTRMQAGPAAYGYLTTQSNYDGTMYVLGLSPSKTSISGPQVAVSKGSSVVLTGSVLDQAPASLDIDPAGIACVSDKNMDVWMDYIHFQMPIDGLYHNVTIEGVPVMLYAENQETGESIYVGEAYTDATGSYSYLWTPDDVGMYTVTATFIGSNAYGASWDSTGVGVVAEEKDSQPNFALYIICSTIVILVAVLLIIFLLVRKK